jgi:hypothetical protein
MSRDPRLMCLRLLTWELANMMTWFMEVVSDPSLFWPMDRPSAPNTVAFEPVNNDAVLFLCDKLTDKAFKSPDPVRVFMGYPKDFRPVLGQAKELIKVGAFVPHDCDSLTPLLIAPWWLYDVVSLFTNPSATTIGWLWLPVADCVSRLHRHAVRNR